MNAFIVFCLSVANVPTVMFPELQIILPASKSTYQSTTLPLFVGYSLSDTMKPFGHADFIRITKLKVSVWRAVARSADSDKPQNHFPGSNPVDGNHDGRVDTRQLAKLHALRLELAEPLDGRNDRLLSVWPVHERGFHGSPS